MSDKVKVLTAIDLLAKIRKTNPDFMPPDPAKINPLTNELIQVPFSGITSKPIQWLWEKRIARGKVTVFAGDPGKGKSQLLLWIAATCSNGGIMPVDKSVFPQGKVAILSAEDDEDDTISPRLKALNANLANVIQLKAAPKINEMGILQDETVRLDQDLQKLDNTFANHAGYILLIIDPITAYLGDINDYKNSEIRALITKLTNIARKHGIAIILNTHLSKPGANGSNAMSRVSGSIAYVAAARAAYIICDQDDNDKTIKQFIPMKNNIGDDKTGFEYKIISVTVEDHIGTSRIDWLPDSIMKTANEALNKSLPIPTPKCDEAIAFLLDCLKNGTCFVRDIRKKADELNISPGRLYAAKEKLKVIEDYSIEPPQRKFWTLPV